MLRVVIEQPDRAGVAAALFDHRFRQAAEEAFDVGLLHEQIDRELDDFHLNVRTALRTAALTEFARQRLSKNLRIGGRYFPRRLMTLRMCVRLAPGVISVNRLR